MVDTEGISVVVTTGVVNPPMLPMF